MVLDDDGDDMNPDANGAVVINLGGHHPEDGMVEAGAVNAHADCTIVDASRHPPRHKLNVVSLCCIQAVTDLFAGVGVSNTSCLPLSKSFACLLACLTVR